MKKINIEKLLKHTALLLIVLVCFYFIDNHKDGFSFAIIALACWAFTFLDLARIKIKEFEVEFMSRKDAFTADEKKEFVKCYDLLQQFFGFFIRDGYVNDEALECIWKARDQARLYLPKKLEDYIEEYFEKALNAHHAFKLWQDSKTSEKTKKWADERHQYEMSFFNMNIADTFKPYLKVKTEQKDN